MNGDEAGIESRESKVEASPLLVSKEVAQDVLKEIAENPERSFNYGALLIDTENPALGEIFSRNVLTGSVMPHQVGQYMEGVNYTYVIFKRQAEARKADLPVFPEEGVKAFFADMLEDIGDSEISIKEFTMGRFSRLKEEEPHLASAIEEIAKYRRDPYPSFWGAVSVYEGLKKAQEIKGFKSKFE